MFKLICKTLDDRIYVIDAKNLIKSWDSEEEIKEFNDVEFDDSEFSHLEEVPKDYFVLTFDESMFGRKWLFNHNKNFLLIQNQESIFELFRLSDNEKIYTTLFDQEILEIIEISLCGQFFLLKTSSKYVFWDRINRKTIKEFDKSCKIIENGVNADLKYIAYCSSSDTLHIYDTCFDYEIAVDLHGYHSCELMGIQKVEESKYSCHVSCIKDEISYSMSFVLETDEFGRLLKAEMKSPPLDLTSLKKSDK